MALRAPFLSFFFFLLGTFLVVAPNSCVSFVLLQWTEGGGGEKQFLHQSRSRRGKDDRILRGRKEGGRRWTDDRPRKSRREGAKAILLLLLLLLLIVIVGADGTKVRRRHRLRSQVNEIFTIAERNMCSKNGKFHAWDNYTMHQNACVPTYDRPDEKGRRRISD